MMNLYARSSSEMCEAFRVYDFLKGKGKLKEILQEVDLERAKKSLRESLETIERLEKLL